VGDKRISIRTLPTGEKVEHHPSDHRHPDGKLVLIPGICPLKERHANMLGRHREHQRTLREGHQARALTKRELQRRGGIPAEKRHV
jgi:hypothetical protein